MSTYSEVTKCTDERGHCNDWPEYACCWCGDKPWFIVEEAERMARRAHKNMRYGPNANYFDAHIQSVIRVLFEFGILRDEILAAAYLHDVVEDTHIPIGRIESEFGTEVATIVAAVTKLKTGSRKEKRVENLPRVAAVPEAIVVKLADRIANVKSGAKNDMYKKEQTEFKAALCKPELWPVQYREEVQAMWNRLDALLA